MKTITFFKRFGDLDAEARASGTPIPFTLAQAKPVIDALAKGKYERIWLPNGYAMKWKHPDLNARNTRIEFLGNYDDLDKRAIRGRLPA